MSQNHQSLGRLVSTHAVSSAHLQRAVFIAVLSFLFFLAMMFAFYVRQSIGYFLLATAFLLIYLITMFSWVIQRRSVIRVFEKGIQYKGRAARWNDIESISARPPYELRTSSGMKLVLPASIGSSERIASTVRDRIAAKDRNSF